jgi:cytochrome b561
MRAFMPKPKGYAPAQIGLHWAVAALVALQFILQGHITEAWSALREGGVPYISAAVLSHVFGGIAILGLVIWRLILRRKRGAPEAPEGTPVLMRLAANVAHWALYGLLIVVPVTGMLAWFGGIGAAAWLHSLLRIALFFLIILHILGAMLHAVIGYGVMGRMFQADRSVVTAASKKT